MKLYKNLDNFRFRAKFSTWLYRVTANTALNHIRKVSTRSLSDTKYRDSCRYTPTADDPAEAAARKDERQILDVLLAKLSPEQRACIVLRNIEGLTYEQIAAALEVNINTVRTRLRRARQKLLSLGKEVVKDGL